MRHGCHRKVALLRTDMHDLPNFATPGAVAQRPYWALNAAIAASHPPPVSVTVGSNEPVADTT